VKKVKAEILSQVEMTLHKHLGPIVFVPSSTKEVAKNALQALQIAKKVTKNALQPLQIV
jgi:hypothetical protein